MRAPTIEDELRQTAAALGNDTERIFTFVRDSIAFEAYDGALRGPIGTLWTGAGNSVDKSLLLADLLRHAGVRVAFSQGRLDDAEAAELIESMFKAPERVVGCLPDGAATSDPTARPDLRDIVRAHTWVRLEDGTSLDPSFAAARAGDSFGEGETRADAISDASFHRVRVRLSVETKTSFQNDLTTSTVLDRTFRTADVYGRPLTLGHYVNSRTDGGGVTFTYVPYLVVGQNDARVDDDPLSTGTTYTEHRSTLFPLANHAVFGATVRFDVQAPGKEATVHERSWLDRVGVVVRERGGTVTVPTGPPEPAFTEADIYSTLVLPGRVSVSAVARQQVRVGIARDEATTAAALVSGTPPANSADRAEQERAAVNAARRAAVATAETVPTVFAVQSDKLLDDLQSGYLTRAYYDSPRLLSSIVSTGAQAATLKLDLRKNDARVIPHPGQLTAIAPMFEFMRGYLETALEAEVVTAIVGRPAIGVLDSFEEPGSTTKLITADTLADLEDVQGLSEEGEVRITRAVRNGKAVLVSSPVRRTAWIEVDQASGHTIGVSEDGGHQAMVGYAMLLNSVTRSYAAVITGLMAGFSRTIYQFLGNFLGDVNQGIDGFVAVKNAKRKVLESLKKEVLTHYGDALASLLFPDEPFSSAGTTPGRNVVGFGRAVLRCLATDAAVDKYLSGQPFLDFGSDITNCLLTQAMTMAGKAVGPYPVNVMELGVLMGMAWGYDWLTRSLPVDPQVFPFLSSDLGPAPAPVDGGATSGLRMVVERDALFVDDVGGVPSPSVFKVRIQNSDTVARRVAIQAFDLPGGFSARPSVNALTLGPGRTGEVGMCVRAPEDARVTSGTHVPFKVRVTGEDGSEAVGASSFTVPKAAQLAARFEPAVVSGQPGATLPVTLIVRSAGEVPLQADVVVSGPSANGLPSSLQLQPGAEAHLPVTVTIPPLAPGASRGLRATLTYCPLGAGRCDAAPLATETAWLEVLPRIEGAACLYDGLDAATRAGEDGVAASLRELIASAEGVHLQPTDARRWGVVTTAAKGLLGTLSDVPWLGGLQASTSRIEQAAAQRSFTPLIEALSSAGCDITTRIRSRVGITLPPEVVLTMGEEIAIPVGLSNPSTDARSVALSVQPVVQGVDASFSSTSVVIGPSETITAQQGATTLRIQAVARQVSSGVLGVQLVEDGVVVGSTALRVVVRAPIADVLSARADPIGGSNSTGLEAMVVYRGSAPLTVSPFVELLSATGTVEKSWETAPQVLQPSAVPSPLSIQGVDLPPATNTARRLRVSLRDGDGQRIEGLSAYALLVGREFIEAAPFASPAVTGVGDSTIATQLRVRSRLAYTGATCTGGRVIVGHDTNTLSSSLAGPNELRFALQLAGYLTEGRPGKRLLLFDSEPANTTTNIAPSVVAHLRNAGYSVDITADYGVTSEALRAYDAVFVDTKQTAPHGLDNTALAAFVASGGGVYLVGGVVHGRTEADAWRGFLNPMGIQFTTGANGLTTSGAIAVHSEVFEGIPSLAAGNGSPIVVTGSNLNSVTLHSANGHPLYVAYQECGRRPLDITQKWAWRGSTVEPASKEVISTPMVANLNDDNGDGKVDRHDVPDVVFVTTSMRGGSNSDQADGIVRAVSGLDGASLFDAAASGARTKSMANIAVADVDGDGEPEIVGAQSSSAVILSARGLIERVISPIELPLHFIGAPTIADLDADGVPEIVLGRTVFHADGSILFTMSEAHPAFGSIPVIADLDGDRKLDIVLGSSAYSHDGRLLFGRAEYQGYPAVADVDLDGSPEVLVAGQSRLYCFEADGQECWAAASLGQGRGGPPTVADMDGDGSPDVGVASADYYSVFDGRGRLKWRQPIYDFSSHLTGSTAFDFDGDGRADVLYGDERYLRVFRGIDGAVLFSAPNPSCTAMEYPVVADVDADGVADLVAGMNQVCGAGAAVNVFESGITVWSSPSRTWAGTRRIWNQHAYSITNIDEDARVPREVAPNWSVPGLNNFRLNTQLPSEGGRVTLDVDVQHRLPPAGFTATVDSARPAASEASAQALRWDVTLPPEAPGAYEMSFDGLVKGMSPGEVRAVSAGTTVTASFTDERGERVESQVELPPLYVSAPFVPAPDLRVLPTMQIVDAGAQATFEVELRNTRPATGRFALALDGLDTMSAQLPTSVDVGGLASTRVPLTVTVPATATPGRVPFMVRATSADGATALATGTLVVVRPQDGPAVTVELPPVPPLGLRQSTIVLARVTNTGRATGRFAVGADAGCGATASLASADVVLLPGLAGSRLLPVSLTAGPIAATSACDLRVTTALVGNPAVNGSAMQPFTVTQRGVRVRLVSVEQPTTYIPAALTFEVTNLGAAADRFALAVEGALAPGARLDRHELTLDAGRSAELRIPVSALVFVDALLALRATSVAEPHVTDVAFGGLADSVDVTAVFDPPAIVLPTPGAGTFLLQVANQSRREHEYRVALVSSENTELVTLAPSRDDLVKELVVRVPAGAVAGLPATAVMAAPGRASLTVSVTSITDPAVKTTATASLLTPEPLTDDDQDGLPTEFERCVGLDEASASGDSGPNGDPDGDGRTNLQELDDGTNPRGFVTRYFAEGANSGFFNSRIALANPSTEAEAHVWLRFLLATGKWITHCVAVPPQGRRTVDTAEVDGLRNAEFATAVESDVPVVSERTMTWDRAGYGAHAESSVDAAATEWFLAEGATIGRFQLFYLIQNATFDDADVEVAYLLPAPTPPVIRRYRIAAGSRFNIWVNEEAPELRQAEVSARIRSVNGVPIIVERAMYLDGARSFEAGHGSAGITAPASRWFLAEGATGNYFDLFVLVANPSLSPTSIKATFLLPAGETIERTYTVGAQSRFNIWVDLEDARLADTAVSVIVESTDETPIVVERAMWWPGPTSATWHESHNSAGATQTGTTWALAEGEVGGPTNLETYVLIANTSTVGGEVKVTVLLEDGGTVTRTYTLAPNSRANVAMKQEFPEVVGHRFGVIIESVGETPLQLVVERAMYSDSPTLRWAAGTNAVGTRLK